MFAQNSLVPDELSDHDRGQVEALLRAISEQQAEWTAASYAKVVKRFPLTGGKLAAKDLLIRCYSEWFQEKSSKVHHDLILHRLLAKPIRTSSGVTPVTVLTKPFPCPGKCIFCPNDIRMPKSYLSDEPGAQRAERNFFDPYLQTYNRLQALHNIGHAVAKVEIIVLGGTWSFYPEAYQIWFIKECFRALNEFPLKDDRENVIARYHASEQKLKDVDGYVPSSNPQQNKEQLDEQKIDGRHLSQSYNQVISHLYVAPERKAGLDTYQRASWDELSSQQHSNETASSRCVGLVIETRPDNISEAEVIRIRKLGCTKTQIGVQSLQDEVLEKNNRGHDVAATRHAFSLLRQAGFKIHAHWMANLYGSSPAADQADFDQLFSDPDFKPDELKIYPCSLIESAELMQYYQEGKWQPFSKEELLEVVSHCLVSTPEYCRLTRVIRDIPSTDIVVGNKLTNFRELAEKNVRDEGLSGRDIRSREIRGSSFDPSQAKETVTTYTTSVSTEHFLQIVTPDDKLLAFLRLSLPTLPSFMPELHDSAMIREVHVYGQVSPLGESNGIRPQHLGFGKKLIASAQKLAREAGFAKLAVISAVGTREYYRGLGFENGELYQWLSLTKS